MASSTGKSTASRIIEIPNWTLSWRSYVCGTFCFMLRLLTELFQKLGLLTHAYFGSIWLTVIIQLLGLAVLACVVKKRRFDVAWRAYFLGCILSIGLTLATYSSVYQSFGMYCVAMSVFHWSEYMLQSIYNPETTAVDSYMLYHSHAYVIAFIASMIEFWTEMFYFPRIKSLNLVTNLGIMLVIFGEGLRKVAMVTAKSNFNHYVQFDKADDHQLVTDGVYALFRHPSYVGWFWWSIGTQITLANPICAVLYAIASWKFFNDRIYHEEITLINFFQEKYLDYQKQVCTGLPFIKGYQRPTITRPEGRPDTRS